MEKLKREHDTAIMLITHDMGVVSELADDVAVMYMGSIVERGSVREVLKYPALPTPPPCCAPSRSFTRAGTEVGADPRLHTRPI